MSDILRITVALITIACMYFAQHKTTPKPTQRLFSLLGGIASVLIAVDAQRHDEAGVFILFALAAGISLISLAMHYLKPSKPDA